MHSVNSPFASPARARPYDQRFEVGQIGPSLRSARLLLGHLWRYLQPRSVAEVGCGRGAWLKAFRELGAETLFGYDGPWNSPEMLIDGTIEFHAVDMNAPFALPSGLDLAMSLEVAAHLDPSLAGQFVGRLTGASNAVLFSAASLGPDGEQLEQLRHSRWAELFAREGFQPFDLFRSRFWGDRDLSYWHRQNTFLYARSGSAQCLRLRQAGAEPLADAAMVDRGSPELYGRHGALPGKLPH